jgi:leucyl-tRNA synthetase
MTDYNPNSIETAWQNKWQEEGLYDTVEDPKRPKWYALTMLPYPSGDLHAGHWYAMTPSDAAARFRRMQGYNVFFPMGFDAFGLPAENAAIKHNIHPGEWTKSNIERMRGQLRQMGAMYAWDHEAITCLPGYYQWTQWFFLRLREAGLAYKEFAPVDWCPSCQTTLAKEQVWGDDRHCERCKTPVTKKDLHQWKLRITRYAEELLKEIPNLEWPERVKQMQVNWIGRSTGALVTFPTEARTTLEVFTTRPDTLWGATFMVLAPEHPLVSLLTTPEQHNEVRSYQEWAASQDEISRTATDREKTGVFTGGYATNPATGEQIPVWISDYVLMGYGTGAIMAVPAHDQRDFEFARKFGLKITPVISPDGEAVTILEEAYTDKTRGFLINSGVLSGTPVEQAVAKAVEWLEQNHHGEASTNYRLHDWLISRQRMWGCPIPMIKCPDCGDVPVPYEQLPVVLPADADFKPTGESPLKTHPDFQRTTCPSCKCENAERETDTMDTFMCSSWYQYGYVSPYWKDGETITRDDLPWKKEQGDYWLPVDQYTGGVEHATMHLLYTRFFSKALRDMGLVTFDEPMRRLFSQGMILGPDGEKMSKSRGNVVNPDEYVTQYGADTVRGYIMFIGPWDQGGPWDPGAIEGIKRFLNKVWNLCHPSLVAQQSEQDVPEELTKQTEQLLHQTIQRVTESMETFRFNTAIAGCMEFNNHLSKFRNQLAGSSLFKESVATLLKLMAPIFPHITEELWHACGNQGSVHLEPWPQADAGKAQKDQITVVVQVNGKVRDKILTAPDTPKEELQNQAMNLPNVVRWTDGKEIRKVIVVPNKLVNIVV